MIGTKTCTRCKENKSPKDFQKRSSAKDGLHSWCKQCYSEWAKEHYLKNLESNRAKHRLYASTDNAKEKARERARTDKAREKRREYQRTHAEHIKKYQHEYCEANKERIREQHLKYQRKNKDKVREWHAKYRALHAEQLQRYNKEYREKNKTLIREKALARLHSDPKHKMKEQTRNMIRYALRSSGHRKESNTKDILGCDLDFFCDYLKSTWEKNYGRKWNGEAYHIDHIIPLATATSKNDVLRLCHYTNLQMLTPEDNMAKSDKLDWQ